MIIVEMCVGGGGVWNIYFVICFSSQIIFFYLKKKKIEKLFDWNRKIYVWTL